MIAWKLGHIIDVYYIDCQTIDGQVLSYTFNCVMNTRLVRTKGKNLNLISDSFALFFCHSLIDGYYCWLWVVAALSQCSVAFLVAIQLLLYIHSRLYSRPSIESDYKCGSRGSRLIIPEMTSTERHRYGAKRRAQRRGNWAEPEPREKVVFTGIKITVSLVNVVSVIVRLCQIKWLMTAMTSRVTPLALKQNSTDRTPEQVLQASQASQAQSMGYASDASVASIASDALSHNYCSHMKQMSAHLWETLWAPNARQN